MRNQSDIMSPDDLRERIARIPRVSLVAAPTPLEAEPNLSTALGGPQILVKRDDLTGLVFGGNKVRELEFFVGDALAKGADIFVAGGGVGQSNHARQCAAAALRAGIHPVVVLRHGPTGTAPTGNLLITRLLGADIHWTTDDPEIRDRGAMATTMDRIAQEYREQGYHPYVLYSSVHPLGALGYVECALELAEQIGNMANTGTEVSIYVTSMGVTHVGLALGLALLGIPWKITGVGWRPLMEGLPEQLSTLADQTAELLCVNNPLSPADFTTLDFGGPVYGVPGPDALEALVLCARTDALLLDPAYTAKGMAGLISQIRNGTENESATVVFVHTGGLPALFAYSEDVLAATGSEDNKN